MVVVYAVLAVAGAVLPWYFNLQLIAGPGFELRSFLAGVFANPASSSIGVDILVGATAFCAWMIHEARRLGMKHWWAYLVITLFVSFACACPLFLLMRERRLRDRNGGPKLPGPATLAAAGIAGLLAVSTAACDSGGDTTSGSGATGASTSAGGAGGGGAAGPGGAGGDTGGSGGTGGGGVPQVPCPAGSELSAADTDAGYAEFGSVFSSTKYERDVDGTHNPKALVVEVKASGAPVPGCEVRWETASGHGWVFPNNKVTDAEGRIRAYWTAGDQGSQSAVARIEVEGGAAQTVTFTGEATPSERTRTDSVHILYDVPEEYTEFKTRVTPVTGPQSTYYSTLNWPGAYGGVQFDDYGGPITKVLFSVWDIDETKKAEILDAGACNETVGFGGEGTGTSCRLLLPPSEHGPIPGLPDDYMLKTGDTYETHLVVTFPADCPTCTDYTFTFTDVTRGLGPISLGTQRRKEKVTPWYGSGFVEDWWDEPGDHCLNSGTRTAYFHDLQAKTASGWQPITSASFNAVYAPGNHEICANYFFGVKDGKFLVSSGGSELISRPIIQGDPELGELPKESL